MQKVGKRKKVFLDGKEVLTKTEIKSLITHEFQKSQGHGARTLDKTLKRKYVGLSERKIRKILHGDKVHGRMNARFMNKPPLKSIQAPRVYQRIHIDLMDMKTDIIKSGDHHYRYILSFLDVFSRFVVIRPLRNKKAESVTRAVKEICATHGYPDIIQTDNGTEFHGKFKRFVKSKGIKHIISRPYHPKAKER